MWSQMVRPRTWRLPRLFPFAPPKNGSPRLLSCLRPRLSLPLCLPPLGAATCRGSGVLERLCLSDSMEDKKKRAKLTNADLIGAKLGEPLVGAILSKASVGTTVTRDGVSGEADMMVQTYSSDCY